MLSWRHSARSTPSASALPTGTVRQGSAIAGAGVALTALAAFSTGGQGKGSEGEVTAEMHGSGSL